MVKIFDNVEAFLKKGYITKWSNFIFTIVIRAIIIAFSMIIMKLINSMLKEGIEGLRRIFSSLNEGRL
ncbi:hypothetical protein D3C76_1489660 [compost metagenome]